MVTRRLTGRPESVWRLGRLHAERRVHTHVVAIASLLGAAYTQQPNAFLLVSLLIGFSSVSVQILIPLAAHLAPEESRGRVVGGIMGGLLLGILLARPVSSVVADHFGWRAMFVIAAVLMAACQPLPANDGKSERISISFNLMFKNFSETMAAPLWDATAGKSTQP